MFIMDHPFVLFKTTFLIFFCHSNHLVVSFSYVLHEFSTIPDQFTLNGENEREVFRQALLAARNASVPLMIHHTNSTISLDEVLERLDKGDVYTHTFRQVVTLL